MGGSFQGWQYKYGSPMSVFAQHCVLIGFMDLPSLESDQEAMQPIGQLGGQTYCKNPQDQKARMRRDGGVLAKTAPSRTSLDAKIWPHFERVSPRNSTRLRGTPGPKGGWHIGIGFAHQKPCMVEMAPIQTQKSPGRATSQEVQSLAVGATIGGWIWRR